MGVAIARQAFGFLLGLSLASSELAAAAEPLEAQLESTLAALPGRFLGYETIPHRPSGSAPEKYLILDFRFSQLQPEQLLQTRVHSICQAVLLDQNLISILSAGGYDRLAVAFDREYQYDCF